MGYTFFHDEALCADAVLTRSADAGTGFSAFAETILKGRGLKAAPHQIALIKALQNVASGSIDRLMVQMPPGAAKSTYASVYFPAFWFSVHRQSDVIAASHTASLAEHIGRQLRGLIREDGAAFGLALDSASRAAGRFGLVGGGQYFAAGIKGPITGRRADLIVIDDPIKSWAEADSEKSRNALYNWYRAELLSRLKPGGRVVLVMTRWHPDDLAGRLALNEGDWTVLRFPALAEAGDPLGRLEGEALWPAWETTAATLRKRASMGERAFSALYQQCPTLSGGLAFHVEHLVHVSAAPAVVRAVRAWDLAATVARPGRDPDWTVGLKLGVLADERLVVLDVVRVRAGPADVERLLIATAQADGSATVVGLPQDPGQAGVAQVAFLKRSLAGFQVHSSPESGAKLTRTMPVSTLMGNNQILVVQAAWTRAFVAELQAFPGGEKDDQVDALSRAVSMIQNAPAPSRVTRFSLMER